jgi:hypothetical protein
LRRSAFYAKQYSHKNFSIDGIEKPTKTQHEIPFRPHKATIAEKRLALNPSDFLCSEKSDLLCQNRTTMMREIILNEFHKGINQVNLNETNYYNVNYYFEDKKNKKSPYCKIYDAKVKTLSREDYPFDNNYIGKFFPHEKLFTKKERNSIKSCAIISSAGSMKSSRLGIFIGKYIYFYRCLIYNF